MIEYYHADRLNYAVAGTPNRLEYDQGFFVKLGDGAADVKPIAHLYKTQVYALAAHLGVPEEICRRPPTTDTYSLPQTQEEFYFALPYDKMDLCLYAHNHGVSAEEVAPVVGITAEQVTRVFRDIEAKRRTTRYLHAGRCSCTKSRSSEMCGIGGIVALRGDAYAPARAQLLRMTSALRHRGPDQSGVATLGRAGLAHTRLSIIDLAGGRQPYTNDDSSMWLVYNGEVFNYIELREELEALGRRFRSESDTEVVLRAYEHWGEAAFERFNGQFAIGIWDRNKEKLVLARDRLGVRPLYICEHGGRITFASEIKAIFARRSVDPARARSRRDRPDVHVLVGARTANGLRRDRGAAARPRA